MPDRRDPIERWLYAGALAALIGGAWVALGLVGASAYAPYLSHTPTGAGASPPVPLRLFVFVAGWTLMSIAMMLPSSLPLVTVFHTITRAGTLVAVLVAGYLVIWALFGLAASVADSGLHELVEAVPGLRARTDIIPGTLLLAAGLFQFSPLKSSCLRQCRSPVGFVVQHWRGGHRAPRAFLLGVRHGVFCVGCCWALMLLMFAVGGLHLGWMFLLGTIMFVEKAVRWGRWVTAPAGALLTLWGLALLLKFPGIPPPF